MTCLLFSLLSFFNIVGEKYLKRFIWVCLCWSVSLAVCISIYCSCIIAVDSYMYKRIFSLFPLSFFLSLLLPLPFLISLPFTYFSFFLSHFPVHLSSSSSSIFPSHPPFIPRTITYTIFIPQSFPLPFSPAVYCEVWWLGSCEGDTYLCCVLLSLLNRSH